jgi:hypothetical protein
MKTTSYDEREVTEWLHRHRAPALAWAVLIAFFAVAGLTSRDEPRQLALAAPAVPLLADETDGVPDLVFGEPSAREPALRDAAVVVHEALDPVGVGLNTTR